MVWNEEGRLRLRTVEELPGSATLGGNVFQPTSDYLGDVDVLRDQHGRLVGFAYIIGEPTCSERMLINHVTHSLPWFRQAEGVLSLMIAPAEALEVQHYVLQTFGTVIFRTSSGDVMIAIPVADTDSVAFPVGPVVPSE